MASETVVDRLSIRQRPEGSPLIYQSWEKLLFLHWPLPPELLRPHLPERLTLDSFDGQAWVAVTPFTVRHTHPAFLPPFPWIGNFHEVNVRTYVHYRGVPGVWFFSLDAASPLAVFGARSAYHLPYFTACMELKEQGSEIRYHSVRNDSGGAVALDAVWRKGEVLGEAQPATLEFFLAERYCLYAARGDDLYRARIHHRPWRLQKAELVQLHSSMLAGQGLPEPAGTPLLHYSEFQHTAIWPGEKLA